MDYLYSTGSVPEADYKYTAKQGTCTVSSSSTNIVAKSGPRKVKIDSTEVAHLAALNYSPISVVLDSAFLYYYKKGVILDNDESNPCFLRLSHAVTMVGYGTDPKYGDYYLVKNTWGANWGENGYFRISRALPPGPNKDKGACGILSNSY